MVVCTFFMFVVFFVSHVQILLGKIIQKSPLYLSVPNLILQTTGTKLIFSKTSQMRLFGQFSLIFYMKSGRK